MSGTGEDVQFLQESQDKYRDTQPPFCRVSRKTPAARYVQLVDTGEVQKIHYRIYLSAQGKFSYGTIRIKGLCYIIYALPKDWTQGETTKVPGGCKDWFAWQGPGQGFRGQLFEGPVARSAAKIQPQAAPTADASPSQPSRNPSGKAQTTSSRDTSPGFYEGSPEPDQAYSHAASHPDTVRLPSLTPRQECDTVLDVKIYKDRENYFLPFPLRLSSARPPTDPTGAVTNESLFVKITKMAIRFKPSLGYINALVAIFNADLLDKTEASDDARGDLPRLEPRTIIRGEPDTFEGFQSNVLALHELSDKVSWRVVLRVDAELCIED